MTGTERPKLIRIEPFDTNELRKRLLRKKCHSIEKNLDL